MDCRAVCPLRQEAGQTETEKGDDDMSRTRFMASIEKRNAVKDAEAAGTIADNMAVRIALMDRVNCGEITLAQAQAELQKIKRGAKRAGKITRAQAFSRG